jgi:hypothetical protein
LSCILYRKLVIIRVFLSPGNHLSKLLNLRKIITEILICSQLVKVAQSFGLVSKVGGYPCGTERLIS